MSPSEQDIYTCRKFIKGFSRNISNQYKNTLNDYDDFVQTGEMSLLCLLDKKTWDFNKGDFITYAKTVIKNAILKETKEKLIGREE